MGILEVQAAALRNGAQVGLQFLLRHADAVVADGEGACVLVRGDPDGVILPGHAAGAGFQIVIIPLVQRIAGIADQFPDEDLPVRINRVDHHIQQFLGFCLELFLRHMSIPPSLCYSLLALFVNECQPAVSSILCRREMSTGEGDYDKKNRAHDPFPDLCAQRSVRPLMLLFPTDER